MRGAKVSKNSYFYNMIKIDITPEHLQKAKNYYNFKELPNSLTKGGGNIYGALGEILVLEHYEKLGLQTRRANTFDYDLILDSYKVDVKSRVIKKSLKPWNGVTIPAYSKNQKLDFYVFVFILKDFSKAWLAGYMKKERFFDIARLYKKDEPSGFNFNFMCDTYQVIVRQLKPITPL